MMSVGEDVKSSPGLDGLVLVCCYLVYMNYGFTFVNGLIVTEMLVAFQAGETLTTWVASLQVGLCLCVGLVAGALVEQYGNRKVVISGTLIGALGFILSAFVTDIGLMFVTFSIISGVGIGLQHIPCIVVPQLVFSRRRVFAVACVLSGASSGCFIYPVMFNGFREIYGFRGALLLWGAIMLNSVPLGYLMTSHPALSFGLAKSNANDKLAKYRGIDEGVPVSKSTMKTQGGLKEGHSTSLSRSGHSMGDVPKQDIPTDTDLSVTNGLHSSQQESRATKYYQTVSMESISKPSLVTECRRIADKMVAGFSELRSGPSLLVFLAIFLMACGYLMPYIFIPLKTTGLMADLGIRKDQVAWLVSSMGIADTVSRLVVGVVANIFEEQITIIYGIAMITASCGCLAMALAYSFYTFLFASILFGASVGAFVCLYTQAVIAIVGLPKVIRMIGLISFAWGIAYMCMPAFGAFIFETSGDINAPFYMAFGGQLLAAALQLGYRISPQYKYRPGAQHKDEPMHIGGKSFATESETRSIAYSMCSDAASLRLGSQMDIRASRGTQSWRGSTQSHI